MATYEELHGKRVEVFDADPTLTSAYEGQVWYNSATGTLKSVVALEAWSSSSSLGSARYDAGGGGIQTAGLCFGGNGPYLAATEEYTRQFNETRNITSS